MKLSSLASLVPLAILTSCSTVAPPASGAPSPAATAAPPARASADPTDADLAALRKEGRPALDRLLATYDRTAPGPDRDALERTIDRVAAQRYATASRLYWHTDLDAALAESRATGKPVLSLRMLGRLDEDLSCANSRFFRTALYPDPRVAALLRDHFVLHWSSERLVPRITVDYGDGRRLETTITGNSAHYVLDSLGRPIDVLPGLYAPAMFVHELEGSLALADRLRGVDGDAWTATLAAHHQGALKGAAARWQTLRRQEVDVRVYSVLTGQPQAMLAQQLTVSKARVEIPSLRTVDLGIDPGKIPDDTGLWAQLGARLLDQEPGAAVLAPESRALIDRLLAAGGPGVDAPSDLSRAATITGFEQTVLADTAMNEVVLRMQIHGYLGAQRSRAATFTELNRWIYDGIFHTPSTDPWLGLLPQGTFTGLPAGAIVTRAS